MLSYRAGVNLLLSRLVSDNKIHIDVPYKISPKLFFSSDLKIKTGITVTDYEGESGIITSVWGIVFIDPTKPFVCTEIFNSFYGENAALKKMHDKLIKLKEK